MVHVSELQVDGAITMSRRQTTAPKATGRGPCCICMLPPLQQAR